MNLKNIFSKTPENTPDEKFQEEKEIRAAVTIIRTLRDNKLNLPITGMQKIIIDACNTIDPDHKLSERELIQKLREHKDIVEYLKSLGNETDIIDEATIKTYAEEYYKLLREVLSSPDPKAWDEMEYHSQQKLTVLSLKTVSIFRDHFIKIMEEDITCPFYVKKVFNDLIPGQPRDANGMASIGPTEEEEKTAEKIMRLVCPGLETSEKDVFRALVDSLKWRGTAELKRTLEAVKKTSPGKRKLRGRESCLFIEHTDSVTYVG
ncbi:MAG: hypothetical protein PHZ02_01555 [Desulfocapsaceae bacterium]|nr:hypothetical protein [Desulfocapsaceae bacterium]